jgi:hypothetical protein
LALVGEHLQNFKKSQNDVHAKHEKSLRHARLEFQQEIVASRKQMGEIERKMEKREQIAHAIRLEVDDISKKNLASNKKNSD